MPEGFFSDSVLRSAAPETFSAPRCGACGLLKTCQTPKMRVSGRGKRGVLIVGEAPGKDEDAVGRPFVGRAGEKLSALLDSIGVDFRRDCWITNALICRPPHNKIDDERKIDYCRPNLTATIRKLQPHTIITLGKHAVRSVIAPFWRGDIDTMEKWAGWRIPNRKPDCWICPTWHPSYLLRENNPVLDLWCRHHLKRAFEKELPPWGSAGPPDYAARVERIHDPDAAARRIGAMGLLNLPSAFDYETDRLKPDHPSARIVCASISWEGRTTIAYPWAGAAIAATKLYLQSSAPKRGWNGKFENRWSRRILGVTPRNVEWDGMLSAHVLDNRPLITGLKFQAFVHLGLGLYNKHIEPFLDGAGGNGRNQIHKIDLDQLLLYCGLDSLLEWTISEIHRRELNYGPENYKNEKTSQRTAVTARHDGRNRSSRRRERTR